MRNKDSQVNGKRDSEKRRVHRMESNEVLHSEKHMNSLFSTLYKLLRNKITRQKYIFTMSKFMKLMVRKAFNELGRNESGILTFYFDPSSITLEDISITLKFVNTFAKKAFYEIAMYHKSRKNRRMEITEMAFLILPILHSIWADNEIAIFMASKFNMHPEDKSTKDILCYIRESCKFHYPRSFITSSDVVMKDLIEFCENELSASDLDS
ncbi:MAG TPA: hypothetical protein PK250_07560 [Syntrophobacter fumaroxidans]|nr:hypothetical protein [Syntrophobacter fumaroxidans]